MLLSPFQRTAFIDTDAYATESIADLFKVLEKFDLAVAFDPIRSDFVQGDIPDAFPTQTPALSPIKIPPPCGLSCKNGSPPTIGK